MESSIKKFYEIRLIISFFDGQYLSLCLSVCLSLCIYICMYECIYIDIYV